ncbi:MAG: hypothetical protein ONB23_09785 [candidate division KSB1 bacterium]|nr:hypothetical protein [candidate division KSB1 bacterium]
MRLRRGAPTHHLPEILVLCLAWCLASCHGRQEPQRESDLAVSEAAPYAQIEVGGPYVGIEAHRSSPLLNRVSFYYPVANSIDRSEDYWSRDRWRVFFLAVRTGNAVPELIGVEPLAHEVTPYSVRFTAEKPAYALSIAFSFCENLPAFVTVLTLKNKLPRRETFEVRTHLDAVLRTSHSYRREGKARMELDGKAAVTWIRYASPATGPTLLFAGNAGEKPWLTLLAPRDSTETASPGPPAWLIQKEAVSAPAARLDTENPAVGQVYRRALGPGQEMRVVQFIGMCRPEEGGPLVRRVRRSWRREIAAHRRSALQAAHLQAPIFLDDPTLDHGVHWARAVLKVNRHYLDGQLVPMPCPAEYNFFFAHDALMTDLAVCLFDPRQVRRDLLFLARHADSAATLPHAYYWRDDRYVTEFASADNWNHAWLLLVAGRYYRHTQDRETLQQIWPMLGRSLQLSLTNLHKDSLIWAYRPDWWDVGHVHGPRSYLTSLTAAAVQEFATLAWLLGEKEPLVQLERLSLRMKRALLARLWDERRGYLVDRFEDGTFESHLYSGALLAAHLGLLDSAKVQRLVRTAQDYLVDSSLGVRNVWPADFHRLVEAYRLNGLEAGPPYSYLNGGIWPHGNAWYCLALDGIGKRDEGVRYLTRWAAVRAIQQSPGGQAAMFEYRVADRENPDLYGRVDKPQFTWAAGWFLYATYWLYGVREHAWNVYLDPWLPEGQSRFEATVWIRGRPVTIRVLGKGPHVERIFFDGRPEHTLVLPLSPSPPEEIRIVLGTVREPYLQHATAAVRFARWISKPHRELRLCLAAYPGHRSEAVILSPWPAQAAKLNGLPVDIETTVLGKGIYRLVVRNEQRTESDTLAVRF